MKKIFFILLTATIVLVFFLQAHAELFNRGTDSLGNRLIYDSELNITWYDYSRFYNTWQNQMYWASALTVNFGGTIYDDWRLPSTVDGPYVFSYDGTTSYGYNITSSEMGHLFYTELGNKGYCDTSGNCSQTGYGLTNKGPFINLLPRDYWSGTGWEATSNFKWLFAFGDGKQDVNVKDLYTPYALAVRSGDVPVVPEPISSVLFVTGGMLLVGRCYLKKKA